LHNFLAKEILVDTLQLVFRMQMHGMFVITNQMNFENDRNNQVCKINNPDAVWYLVRSVGEFILKFKSYRIPESAFGWISNMDVLSIAIS